MNPRPLQLSAESKTGIKIPPGQIAGGSSWSQRLATKLSNLSDFYSAVKAIHTETLDRKRLDAPCQLQILQASSRGIHSQFNEFVK